MGIRANRHDNNAATAAKHAAEKIGAHSELPPILPFSSNLAFIYRHVGGVSAAIEAARLVAETDERFKMLVFAYDEVSESDKHKLKLEHLCEAASIQPDVFVGMTIAAIFKRNSDIGKLIAAANHPRVIEATVEHAQKVNGFMDRKMMHDHMGFLPLPKGMNINIDNSKKTLIAGGQPEGSLPALPGNSPRTALPSFEEETMSSTRAIRGDAGVGSVQKRLSPPKEQDVILPGDEEPKLV